MANSFWDRASTAWDTLLGREQRNDPLALLREIYGSHASAAGPIVTVEDAVRVSAALACGRVISQGLAAMPFKLMREIGRMIEPALTHRLYDRMMVAPNDLQSAFEFKEQLALHLVFCGNAFVWIPSVSRGIDELYLLEPGWVKVIYSWPDPPRYEVRPAEGEVFSLPNAEVWHVKGAAWSAYIGLETTKLAREALGLSMAIEEGQASIQKNGARINGFVSVDATLAEEQYKKLTRWVEQNSGSANAGRTLILDKAAKWVSQSMSNVDAQMIEMRKFQIEEVCRFFGVMPIMVGYSDKTATYASSEQMFLAHLVHTIGPWATRIEGSADRWLLSKKERSQGLYWKFNEKQFLRMGAKDQAEYLTKLTGGPIMTRNEARVILDLNPLDGLDDTLTPSNVVAGPPPTTKDVFPPPVPREPFGGGGGPKPPPKEGGGDDAKSGVTINFSQGAFNVEPAIVNVGGAEMKFSPIVNVPKQELPNVDVHVNTPAVEVKFDPRFEPKITMPDYPAPVIENHVNVAAAEVSFSPNVNVAAADVQVNVPAQAAPKIDVHVASAPVHVEMQQAPTVQVNVEPTPVNVAAPSVTVEAAQMKFAPEVYVAPTTVNVEAPSVTVRNELPQYEVTESQVVRDDKGQLMKTITTKRLKK